MNDFTPSEITNASIVQATVPQAMQQVFIYLKYIKGDKCLIENYRFISLLLVLSEKVINSNLSSLENNQMLSKN